MKALITTSIHFNLVYLEKKKKKKKKEEGLIGVLTLAKVPSKGLFSLH